MRRPLLLFVAVSCLAGTALDAQRRTASNKPARPSVNEVAPVSLPDGDNNGFDVNGRFAIPVGSQGRVSGKLLVRLFAGTPESLINQVTARSQNNCRIYKSAVMNINPFDGMLDLDFRLDESYLRFDGSRFHDTPYVLVIERGPSSDNIALIDDSAVVDYFTHGFRFVLRARNASLTPDTRRRLEDAETRKKNRERQWKRAQEKNFPGECLTKTR
jgi:hypothetical protein